MTSLDFRGGLLNLGAANLNQKWHAHNLIYPQQDEKKIGHGRMSWFLN